jgi:hypothetical protein
MIDGILDQDVQEVGSLHEKDIRRAWRGLCISAGRRFSADEDVSALLQLIASTPELFEDSSSLHWPVNEIVALLNRRSLDHTWSVGRVDNVKRRLSRWIQRFVQENRLDAIDLEALFVRVARQDEDGQRGQFADSKQPNV